jgi:glycosyltransferase involved in cell wall biosynthesis
MHRHVDAAICVSDSQVEGVLRNGLPAERVHVVHNGIDVSAVRTRAGLPAIPDGNDHAPTAGRQPDMNGTPTVVANGRLSGAKDFSLLVRAHHRVRQAGIHHRLLIMGEGEDRPRIEATIAELGVQDSVTLAGFVPEPYKGIADADLFVLSSLSEGLPLTVLEALAVGTPTVSTLCGTGPGLLLDDGRYGELVPVGDLDALSAAIERHLRDPSPLRERARLGPYRAREFDAGRSAAAVLQILVDLRPRGSAPAVAARGRTAPPTGDRSEAIRRSTIDSGGQ